jgi:hypothetical protein
MSLSPHCDHTRSEAGTSISITSGPLTVPPLFVHEPETVPYFQADCQHPSLADQQRLTVLSGVDVQKLVR